MPPGGHLRPLGGGFLITVAAHKCGLHLDFMMFLFQLSIFASAHKCGLHPAIPAAPNKITALCLSAQMRIASAEKAKQQLGVTTLPQRTNADCIQTTQDFLGDLGAFASAHKCGLHHPIEALNLVHQSLCLSAQMRIASAILHKNAISFFADCAVSR